MLGRRVPHLLGSLLGSLLRVELLQLLLAQHGPRGLALGRLRSVAAARRRSCSHELLLLRQSHASQACVGHPAQASHTRIGV